MKYSLSDGPSSLSLHDCGSFSEKTWFTDEPDDTHLRTMQLKPVNTLAVNQKSHNKSTSSLIPPIREAEDECWRLTAHRNGTNSQLNVTFYQLVHFFNLCVYSVSPNQRQSSLYCYAISLIYFSLAVTRLHNFFCFLLGNEGHLSWEAFTAVIIQRGDSQM